MNTEEKNQIAELLASAKRIAVIPSKLAGPEAYAAGVGLYYLLKNAEKNVTLLLRAKSATAVGILTLKPMTTPPRLL